jgi:hypothetical protein
VAGLFWLRVSHEVELRYWSVPNSSEGGGLENALPRWLSPMANKFMSQCCNTWTSLQDCLNVSWHGSWLSSYWMVQVCNAINIRVWKTGGDNSRGLCCTLYFHTNSSHHIKINYKNKFCSHHCYKIWDSSWVISNSCLQSLWLFFQSLTWPILMLIHKLFV